MGDIVKVKVLEVDPKRRRIALSMRLDEAAGARPQASAPKASAGGRRPAPQPRPVEDGAMAEALRRALGK